MPFPESETEIRHQVEVALYRDGRKDDQDRDC